MKARAGFRKLFTAALLLTAVVFAQKPFRQYPGWEYDDFPLPKDYQVPAEWVFGRLMFPSIRVFRGAPDWRQGQSDWTIDYPRSDRHLVNLVKRLTRVQARSVEQPVNLEDGDDVFNWPWIYGVEVGHWDLSDQQVTKFREYLLRGGFFMCDDFHGTREWAVFAAGMQRVFPDRPIVDIPNDDPVLQTVFNLTERYQVPGAQFLYTGRAFEQDGVEARWRGIYDDKGRLMVAVCHNMDLGDSWEHADDPGYPERYSALGIRTAVNYVVYAMTH